MKKLFSVLSIIILIAFPELSAQENEKGVIRLYSVPDNVGVKISELKFKGTLLRGESLVIENVAEGWYKFIYYYRGKKLKKTIFLNANDTLSVMGSFLKMDIISETDKDRRKIVAEKKRMIFLQDSVLKAQERQLAHQNMEASFSDTAIIFGDTLLIEEEFKDKEIFYIVEEMPMFKGEHAIKFKKFIAQNLRYPEFAKENGISGRVIVQFSIDSNGRLVDAVVVEGEQPLLNHEAIRVVTSSPLWTPGRQRGKAVKVLFTFPVNFAL